MIRLVRGEFGKLFSTKLWLWLLLGGFVLTAVFVSLTIAFDGLPDTPAPRLTTPEGQHNLFNAAAGSTIVWSLILGIIAVTGEFRHQTVTPTFLATPHRGRVVIAKLIAYAIIGIGYGIANIVLATAIAMPWLSAKSIDLNLFSNGIPGVLAGVVAGVAVFGLVGVGLGALIRNQIAAVVGALVYLFVLEGFAGNLPALRDFYKYLPGAANNALSGGVRPNTDLLEPYQGALVLVAYGLLFAFLGTRLTMRRDVS